MSKFETQRKLWTSSPLYQLVDILLSNVDKKINDDEERVLLCNYMDAYNNDYIGKTIDFSEGSANHSEIVKFALQEEDVIITKDSETPDDIAVSAVVVEDLPNVLCGYHLAILRPDKSKINGIFLMNTFHSKEVKNYFINKANGITRYGLTKDVILNALIFHPPIPHQRKIAKILTTVDNVIEKTEQAIEKYKAIKQGMMQDLLTGRVEVDVEGDE